MNLEVICQIVKLANNKLKLILKVEAKQFQVEVDLSALTLVLTSENTL